MIAFTADVDWAPEEVIADTIGLFETYGVHCTFFATHRSETLLQCNRELFEIGLHPNFNPLFQGKGGNADGIMDELVAWYPESECVRSHSLTQSGWLLNKFKEKGMLYEVNHFLPYHHNLYPFTLWNGMVRIPFNWEDDYHFALGYSFDDSGIDLGDAGLKIFNFHPIHVFLNSENNDRYLRIKDEMHNIPKLKHERNTTGVKGTRDMLIALLAHVQKMNEPTYRMKDIYNQHLRLMAPHKMM